MKIKLIKTEPEVGKKVNLKSNYDDEFKIIKFADDNRGKYFEVLEVGKDKSKLKGVPFRVPNEDIYYLKEAEEDITSIKNMIKNHVVCKFFRIFPKDVDAYKTFMEAPDKDSDRIEEVVLYKDLHYKVKERYSNNTVKELKDEMIELCDDLIKLQEKVFENIGRVNIYADELNSDAYNETKELPNSIVQSIGEDDEHITFYTIPKYFIK